MPATPATTTAGRSIHRTLVANTADAVNTVQAATLEVKLHVSSAAPMYFTVGLSADPAVAGDGTYYLDPGEAIKFEDNPPAGPVRVISAGAGAYSVTW